MTFNKKVILKKESNQKPDSTLFWGKVIDYFFIKERILYFRFKVLTID